VADDDDRLADGGGQGQEVVDLAGEVRRGVGRQFSAIEPSPDPHHPKGRDEFSGHPSPRRLVAESAVDHQHHGSRALVLVHDTGRVCGGEVP
jgi:hypothetical protein